MIEYRYSPELREAGRNITGTAIIFNSQSKVLENKFIEIISASAISEAFLKQQIFPMNIEHDNKFILAEYSKGSGSLKPTITKKGVDFSFLCPGTPSGNNALEKIKKGYYTGCSFSFSVHPSGQVWKRDKSGIYVRHINQIAKIYDFSVVRIPAYDKTSVEARSMDDLNTYFETEIRGLSNDDLLNKFNSKMTTEQIENEIRLQDYYNKYDNLLNEIKGKK